MPPLGADLPLAAAGEDVDLVPESGQLLADGPDALVVVRVAQLRAGALAHAVDLKDPRK